MALSAILMVLSLLDSPEQPFPLWGKVLGVLLCLRPIEGDLVHGNVNLFILFLVVAGLVAFCSKRDWLAGMALGLAIACKITPALFVPYFLWKRAWKALAATILGTVIFTWIGFFVVRIPLAYVLALDSFSLGPFGTVHGFNLGLYGCWLAMAADLIIRGIFFTARFAHGGWQHQRV